MGPRCLLCGAGVQVYALSGRGLVGVDDGGTGVKGTRNVVAESGQRQSRMRGRWMRRRRWFAVVAVLALGAQCSVLSARCSTAVQKANGARSACQKPNNATQDLSNPQTASRNVPSRSRFTPCCCLDRRFYLPRTYDKPSPIKKVQIDSLGRPDKSAPTPILPLSPCSEPHSPNPGP